MAEESDLASLKASLQRLYQLGMKLDNSGGAGALAAYVAACQDNLTGDEDVDLGPLAARCRGAIAAAHASQDPEAGEGDEDDGEEDEEAVDEEQIYTSQDLQRFKAVELFLAEKLYQQGKSAPDFFTRYDPAGTGALTPIELRAAFAGMGVALLDEEVRLLAFKFPAKAGAAPGSVQFGALISYLDALRASSSAAAGGAVVKRPDLSPEAARAIIAQVKVPFATLVQRGIRAMREHLYSRSVSVPALFKQLKDGNNLVDAARLAKALLSNGFPENLVPEAELAQFLAALAGTGEGRVPGALNYAEFARFFQGQTEAPAAEESKRSIAQDPSVVAILVKLNSLSLRPVFKALDGDLDGLISVDDVVRCLNEQGLNASVCADPDLREYVSRFAVKTPGKLQYSEFLSFVISRVGPLQPAPKLLSVEVPAHATVVDLVHILHDHTRKGGISLETVFEALTPFNSRRMTEPDVWHALASMGFTFPRELNARLFQLLGPVEGSIDYKDLAITIQHPNRNPRVGSSRTRVAPGGEDNVPLGSGIDQLAGEFRDADNTFRDNPKLKKVYGHSHKFNDQPNSPEPVPAQRKTARQGLGNRSSLKFGDLDAAEEAKAAGAGAPSQQEAAVRMAQQSKGSIDFGGDHGGSVPVSARGTSAQGRPSTFSLAHSSEPSNEPVHLGKRPPAQRPQSDIFALMRESPTARAGSATGKAAATKSSVSFDQADSEAYVPMIHHVAPPGGQTSIKAAIAHDEHAPVTESITGHRRRQAGASVVKSSIDLTFDPHAEAPASARGTRRQFDADSTRGAADHLGSGAVPNPEGPARRVRGGGSLRPAGGIESAGGLGSGKDAALISEVDANALNSPAKQKKAAAAAAAAATQQLDFGGADDAGAGDEGAAAAAAPATLDVALLQAVSKEVYNRGKVKSVYADWCKSGNGLTRDQFVTSTAAIGFPVPPAQADLVFARFDAQGKGTLSLSEFMRILALKTDDA